MIPHGLLADLETWAFNGDRCVEIKKDRGVLKIWVFDYPTMEGNFVETSDDLLTSKELTQRKKEAALAVLSQLEAAE